MPVSKTSNIYLGDEDAAKGRGSNPHVRLKTESTGYAFTVAEDDHRAPAGEEQSIKIVLKDGAWQVAIQQKGVTEPVMMTIPLDAAQGIEIDRDAYDAAMAAHQAPKGP